MDDKNIPIDIDLLTMPSERIYDGCNDDTYKDGKDFEDEEESEFTFDPGPLSFNYTNSHIEEEKETFDRLVAAGKENFDTVFFAIDDEMYQQIDGWALYKFGLGGLALGLAYMGCIPINGGADEISSDNFPILNPYIDFHVPKEKVLFLIEAAEKVGVSLRNGSGGTLTAYCDDVRKFNFMAKNICNESPLSDVKETENIQEFIENFLLPLGPSEL